MSCSTLKKYCKMENFFKKGRKKPLNNTVSSYIQLFIKKFCLTKQTKEKFSFPKLFLEKYKR